MISANKTKKSTSNSYCKSRKAIINDSSYFAYFEIHITQRGRYCVIVTIQYDSLTGYPRRENWILARSSFSDWVLRQCCSALTDAVRHLLAFSANLGWSGGLRASHLCPKTPDRADVTGAAPGIAPEADRGAGAASDPPVSTGSDFLLVTISIRRTTAIHHVQLLKLQVSLWELIFNTTLYTRSRYKKESSIVILCYIKPIFLLYFSYGILVHLYTHTHTHIYILSLFKRWLL